MPKVAMPRFVSVLLFGLVGFFVAAIAGYFIVSQLSSNTHDRSLEAAMTSVFVFGPVGAIIAGAWAVFRFRAQPDR